MFKESEDTDFVPKKFGKITFSVFVKNIAEITKNALVSINALHWQDGIWQTVGNYENLDNDNTKI